MEEHVTAEAISRFILCHDLYRGVVETYRPYNWFEEVMRRFISETGGRGHLLQLLQIYDSLKPGLDADAKWDRVRDREKLVEFFDHFTPRLCYEREFDVKDTPFDEVDVTVPQVEIDDHSVHMTEYNAGTPLFEEEVLMDPLYDIKALCTYGVVNKASMGPNGSQYSTVYIHIYQLYGQTLHLFKARKDIEAFRDGILGPVLMLYRDRDRGVSAGAKLNAFCPRCPVGKKCDPYQQYCSSLGSKTDFVALMLKRSIMNGQRIECAEAVWKIDQQMKEAMKGTGELSVGGIKFFMVPKIQYRWDPVEVKNILTEAGLWRDDVVEVRQSALNKIMEGKPELVGKLQRAIMSTKTEYSIKGEAAPMNTVNLSKLY